MSTSTIRAGTVARHSARVSPVAAEFGRRIGRTPESAHRLLQQYRRQLPLLVRAAHEVGRSSWLDWFFADCDLERQGPGNEADIHALMVTKGALDRQEDAARESYFQAQDDEHAVSLDYRLEREAMEIARARRALRIRHPNAFTPGQG